MNPTCRRNLESPPVGVKALNRALDGVLGATAIHLCFGYAALVHERPSGYSFLPELAECPVQQISIETAQSSLDVRSYRAAGKTIILGVLDLSTHEIETPEMVAGRIRGPCRLSGRNA